ncbi:MAG TPA: hypothetical protein VE178_15820 [Silvibacterium sp.]|nr:hypothetical protein [Silvibacterium sp.]
MRRSSIWFVIATFWLIDTLLRLVRGPAREAWLPAVIVLGFATVGFLHRRHENRTLYRQ